MCRRASAYIRLRSDKYRFVGSINKNRSKNEEKKKKRSEKSETRIITSESETNEKHNFGCETAVYTYEKAGKYVASDLFSGLRVCGKYCGGAEGLIVGKCEWQLVHM